MIYDGRVYADNTIYKSAAACSLQMTLRHVLHWTGTEDAAHLRAGNGAHESLAEMHRVLLRDNDLEAARVAAYEVFKEQYKPFSDAYVKSDDRLYYDNVATILDEWIVTRVPVLPWVVQDPRLIEVGFAYPLDESGRRVAFGRFDLVARDVRDGSWVIPDHKTTGRIDRTWTELWSLDSQLTHYFWASLQHVPDVRGFYVNGIEFSKLPTSDRTCRDHGLKYYQCSRAHLRAEIVGPITRTPDMIERWRADAIRLSDKYAYYANAYNPDEVGPTPDLSNVEMEGPFTGACRFCQFRDWCRLGQKPAMLPAMYIQDPWMPYDPRTYEGGDSAAAEAMQER